MITSLTIGENGRLGNQMFQYAALLGIARHRGYEFYSPGGRLFDVFKMHSQSEVPLFLPRYRINERQFSFDHQLFDMIPDNIDLSGYFQTEKYWLSVKQEIVRIFQVKDEIIESIPNDLLDFCKNSTFIHVRRTDYLSSNGYHPTFDEEFYTRPLEKGSDIAVFTDDVNWGRKFCSHLESCGNRATLVSDLGLRDIQEFYLMTCCKNAVISNSSFSWWAAYLGPHQRDQKVYAPKTWFGENGPKDTQDLYPAGWIKI